MISAYVEALIHELELHARDEAPETIFFGGGTPTLFNLGQWERIFKALDRLNLLGAGEFTVECNPATLSADKARCLRSWGVNRISMGVQSLDEAMLERLGRVHSREMVFKSFDTLRRAGFDNLNLDLMFAIPGQSMEIWRSTLDEALAFGSEHLSCYEVIYEDDTPLFAQLQAGQFTVSEELACEMYDELLERAGAANFAQYEIANFARNLPNSPQSSNRRRLAGDSPSPWGEGNSVHRLNVRQTDAGAPRQLSQLRVGHCDSEIPSHACAHNINYWRGGSFLGLGPSATSYTSGVRKKNWSDTRKYCELLAQGRAATESTEQLSPLARAGETAAFGLRMVTGWAYDEFRRVTGFDLQEEWSEEMDQLVHCGWAVKTAERFRLSAAGLRFADSAAERFLRVEHEVKEAL